MGAVPEGQKFDAMGDGIALLRAMQAVRTGAEGKPEDTETNTAFFSETVDALYPWINKVNRLERTAVLLMGPDMKPEGLAREAQVALMGLANLAEQLAGTVASLTKEITGTDVSVNRVLDVLVGTMQQVRDRLAEPGGDAA